MSALPKKLSGGEELFALHCRAYKLEPIREYQFDPVRKFRFDFCWPSPAIKLAVEIDGGTKFGKSRHSRGAGYENDCRKMNLAVLQGWRVLRFTSAIVVSGEAIDMVLEALKCKPTGSWV